MRTDAVLKTDAFNLLSNSLGLVDAERFIVLINREKFDYTQWRESLHTDETLQEISKKAMDYRKTL